MARAFDPPGGDFSIGQAGAKVFFDSRTVASPKALMTV
jgi:hypothetical protein